MEDVLSLELEALGWNDLFAEHFQPYADRGLIPARVAIVFNRYFRVYTTDGESVVVGGSGLHYRAETRAELPVVGDWIAVNPSAQGGTIQAVLPRRSQFSRKVAGRVVHEQIVAANIDTVFLVSGLDHDFNLRRIERYLIMAWESGAQPVVVLNKADLVDNSEELAGQVANIASGAPVHLTSAKLDEGVELIRSYLAPGLTMALLGSSGVGKSTLINRLIGEDRFRTQEVRVSDSRGRHTTTHRELVLLEGGGLLIDTPGMRELQLWDADEGSDQSFADVRDLAAECRFSNCSHQNEPGCAVQRAVGSGLLDAGRVENFLKIQVELDHLADQQTTRSQIETRRRTKVATRSVERQQRSR
ncbi:MAG: GTPase RsgA [Chloroflexi bacterium]|nr:GTPase RsgA [Chloroflexota bacterium]